MRCRPFRETVDPAAYVALPSRDTSLRRLRYGLEQRNGPAVLYGPTGSGKTIIARRLAQVLGVSPIHLTFPAMSAADLLRLLAEEMGVSYSTAPSMASLIRVVRDRLAAAAACGQRPLLIVDESHLIRDHATFETLRLLLNFASAGSPDLLLLLVGTAELMLQISPGLVDRLAARCLLGPLSEEDSSAYVLGRLAMAGATSPLFTTDALSTLHHAAGGMPRRLNHLADLSLLITYAQGHSQAESDSIAIAAREFDLAPQAA
jgi:type II secretory pathway predicted ATPase ExeA